MTLRVPACAALLAVAAAGPASAQPVPPQPPASAQPAFSPYLGLLGPWGAGYGYWGIAQPQMQLMQQQWQIQQQVQANAQNLANFQNGINMGLVNPYLPLTGRGATFNNLGHWYPSPGCEHLRRAVQRLRQCLRRDVRRGRAGRPDPPVRGGFNTGGATGGLSARAGPQPHGRTSRPWHPTRFRKNLSRGFGFLDVRRT